MQRNSLTCREIIVLLFSWYVVILFCAFLSINKQTLFVWCIAMLARFRFAIIVASKAHGNTQWNKRRNKQGNTASNNASNQGDNVGINE
jgi:hypothetical protein